MPAYEFTSLAFQGYGEQPVPNLFMRQAGAASTLAVVYPGLNYTCDMPLLYYPANLLLERGADVLQVKADYSGAAFQALPGTERFQWAYADAAAALGAGRAQREYAQVVLIGKSIGTLALAQLISTGAAEGAAVIWLTPLLHQPVIVEAALRHPGPALFAVGTGDRTYDTAALARIREATGAEAVFVEGGNHRLEIEGDLYRSLKAMEEVLRGIERFLDRHSSGK
jgi:hypothetical protein